MDDLTGIYVLLFMTISTISRALLLLCLPSVDSAWD